MKIKTTICILLLLLTLTALTAGCISSTRGSQSESQYVDPVYVGYALPIGSIGDIITSKSPTYNINWAITETIRGERADEVIYSGNMFNPIPADGYEYLLYKVKVTNADKDKYMIIPSTWAAYADGVECTQEWVVLPNNYKSLSYIDLMPGATTSGWNTVQVPIGSSVRIYFEPPLYQGQPIYIPV